jgi:ABC-2 type transport system permease protein
MRLYWELIRLSIRRALTYRTANVAGLVTNLFFGFLRVSVMTALYGAQTEVQGLSLHAAITFTGLTQVVLSFLWLFNWWDFMDTINSGDVASNLLRPFDVFGFWMALETGRSLVNGALRGLPIMAAYALFFGLTAPDTPAQWLAFVAALGLAFVISFAWRFLVNLAAFWSTNARGVGRFAFTLSMFLSGFFMPLRFFPDWFVSVCNLTPFPAMVNTPMEVYLGVLRGPELLTALAWQAAWCMALIALCQLVLRAGMRRLVVQGG